MKKTWFFIISFFFIIAAVAGWEEYQARKQTYPTASIPTPTPEPVSTIPNVQNFPNVPVGTTFTYAGPKKDTPDSLPTYQIGPDMTIADLNGIANRLSGQLGFTATSSAAIIKGTYVFTLDQNPLFFYLTRNEAGISFSYQRSLAAGTPTSSTTPDAIAKDFITKLGIVAAPYTLSPLGQQESLKEEIAVNDVPPPPLYPYGFGVTLQNIPVLTAGDATEWGLVVIDGNGIVRLAKAAVPYLNITQENNVKLVSLDSAIDGLNAGKGILIDISSPAQGYFGVTPTFTKGVISNFTIVYVRSGTVIAPAYSFSGAGQAQDGSTQNFTIIVSAITP